MACPSSPSGADIGALLPELAGGTVSMRGGGHDDERTSHRVAVLGAGVMGTAIATLAIGRGLPVVLVDVDEATLAAAPREVSQQLRLARLMGALPAAGADRRAGTPGRPLRTSRT